MRKIVLHIAFLLLVCAAQAQILAPLGNGLPAAPQKIANHKDGIVTVYNDRDDIINLQIWNGDFWYELPTPVLPKTGPSPLGTYEILDLISFESNIYLMTGYATKSQVGATNSILKWDGATWTDISDARIKNSLTLTNLFVERTSLKCIGKFTEGSTESNVAIYNGADWTLQGDLITTNFERDNFNSVVKNGNDLFATGTFTNPENNNLSLVKWNGTKWELVSPPFLDKNITLGSYQGKIVVFGTDKFSKAPIKMSQGANWTNMDAGLDDFTVQNISQFAELDGQLLALGSFVNKETTLENSLMLYDGTRWNTSNISIPNIDQIHTVGKVVALSGDYDDNGTLRGIGQILTNKAQVVARVYNDIDGDCQKDSNEEWLPSYPVQLNEAKFETTEKNGVLYAKLEKDKTYKINAVNYRHYEPTCDDIELETTEYKTYYATALGARQTLGISDGKIYITDNEGNRYNSGEQKVAVLCVSNLGSQPITGSTVTLRLPEEVGDFNSDLAPDDITDNTVTWTIDLSANSEKCIQLDYSLTGFEDITLEASIALTATVAEQQTLLKR